MRNARFLVIIALVMGLLDLYVFQVVKSLTQSYSPKARMTLFIVYWAISALVLLLIFLTPYMSTEGWMKTLRNYVMAILLGLFIAKLIAAVFFLIDDIRRLVTWAFNRLSRDSVAEAGNTKSGISRSAFLSWIGIIAGGSLFSTLIYGFRNKYLYEVRNIRLAYENLPAAFRGLRIVQISDVHSGSFNNKEAVSRGVEQVLQQKPDIILFTGDLVNDRATEMHDYMDVFSKLRAPMGVYSTLGNHDYGDYVQWDSPEAKSANLEALKNVHKELGWNLLMNEHKVFERNGESIALLGIENWGAKGRFPKYGKMAEAYAGSEKVPFKILMSHDPSHWDAQVRTEYPDVDLMLAGHTHGMQFGIEIPGFKWSPVQYMYDQWAGLYEQGRQKLYVNRGYGFIGYPGRVGIMPEITVIDLV
jgi:predicted MPP superfamily phosphohydrolase